jgi:hypothetical protein
VRYWGRNKPRVIGSWSSVHNCVGRQGGVQCMYWVCKTAVPRPGNKVKLSSNKTKSIGGEIKARK